MSTTLWIKRGLVTLGLSLGAAAFAGAAGAAHAESAPADHRPGCPGNACVVNAPPRGVATQHYHAPLQAGAQTGKGAFIGQALGFVHQAYPINGVCAPTHSAVSPSVQAGLMTNAKGQYYVSPLYVGAISYDDGC